MQSVEPGENENHLIFQALIPRIDECYQEFDFTGTNVTTKLDMPEKSRDQLARQLAKDFGHAPYDIEKAEKTLGLGREYCVNSIY